MYITPQTNIKLLTNVPLEPEYTHSLYFGSASAQQSYFAGKAKYNLNAYTYQRYAKGVLRVQILADNLYDVNYMMFQNTAFGNKWFYAFVDKVEYVNDVTTEIQYHIDDIQTWLFNFTFKQCFIERQHSTTDEIGDNILAEPVELGEYVYSSYSRDITIGQTSLRQRAIIVAVTDINEDSQETADGEVYDGIYGACKLFAYSADTTGVQLVNAKINEFITDGHPDSVVSIYMCPRAMVNSYVNTGTKIAYGSSGALIDGLTLDSVGATIDGYNPKNKKLFTYPYNYQSITTGDGEELVLRFEFFENQTPRVNVFGCLSQPVQVMCCPTNYKNVNRAGGELSSYPDFVDEKIVLTSFPLCSWNIDSWKAWTAQNAIPTVLKVLGGAGSVAVGMAGRGEGASMANAGLYALHTATDLLTTMYKASIMADQTKGSISSANALFSRMDYTFHHGRKCINRQQASIIDSFFTRFGYAYNKVGTPNIHARTAFTYIKTLDCSIHGELPADSEKVIENAFNSGITFWTNPSGVGDYTVTNSPL